MGHIGQDDGAVLRSNLDGSDPKLLMPPGVCHTPKQIALDRSSRKVYVADREGLRIHSASYDGTGYEVVIQTGDYEVEAERNDPNLWCVGVGVSERLGKLFWTQKGPSKGGKGRIFSANLPSTDRPDATITNVQCVLDNLPEPIDLEVDDETRSLYWTDRGELPRGNTLNRIQLSEDGAKPVGAKEILAKKFHEAIGLRLDLSRRQVFVTDLGASIYSCKIDEDRKIVLHADERRAFTGVTCI